MLRPVWDTMRVRGLGSLRGEHPGGHGNPGSGARVGASSVTGPRPLSRMRQLAQGRGGGNAGRALDRVPRPGVEVGRQYLGVPATRQGPGCLHWRRLIITQWLW